MEENIYFTTGTVIVYKNYRSGNKVALIELEEKQSNNIYDDIVMAENPEEFDLSVGDIVYGQITNNDEFCIQEVSSLVEKEEKREIRKR